MDADTVARIRALKLENRMRIVSLDPNLDPGDPQRLRLSVFTEQRAGLDRVYRR
jgi:hypothetical protein